MSYWHFATFAGTNAQPNSVSNQQQQVNEGINSLVRSGSKKGFGDDWIGVQGEEFWLLEVLEIQVKLECNLLNA